MCSVGLLISAFNTAVDDFFCDIMTAYPEQHQIASLRNMHRMACRSNIRLPATQFHKHVMLPYGEHLRDFSTSEQFFMTRDFAEVKNQTVVDIIKSLWEDMSPENKENVLGHLHLIVSVYRQISPALHV